jgi:hypothetical protein
VYFVIIWYLVAKKSGNSGRYLSADCGQSPDRWSFFGSESLACSDSFFDCALWQMAELQIGFVRRFFTSDPVKVSGQRFWASQ